MYKYVFDGGAPHISSLSYLEEAFYSVHALIA